MQFNDLERALCGEVAEADAEHHAVDAEGGQSEVAVDQAPLAQQTDAALRTKAAAIHARVLTLDTHKDIDPLFAPDELPSDPATREQFLRKYDPGVRGDQQVDLVKMREAEYAWAFFIVYVGQRGNDAAGFARARSEAFDKFDAIDRMCARFPDDIGLARTPDDVRRVHQNLLGSHGSADLAHMEERLRQASEPSLQPLTLDLLTEAAVTGALTSANALLLATDHGVPSPDQALRDVLAVLEHDGYLQAVQGRWQFVSRLLREWWKGRHSMFYTPVGGR